MKIKWQLSFILLHFIQISLRKSIHPLLSFKKVDEGIPISWRVDVGTHEIASKIEESLTKRETIIPQIQAWCSQPGRYKTADLMLAKIARDH